MYARRLYFKNGVTDGWLKTSQIDPWMVPWVIFIDSVPEGETMAIGNVEVIFSGTLHPYGFAEIKVEADTGSISSIWNKAGNGVTGENFDSGVIILPANTRSFWAEFNQQNNTGFLSFRRVSQ